MDRGIRARISYKTQTTVNMRIFNTADNFELQM